MLPLCRVAVCCSNTLWSVQNEEKSNSDLGNHSLWMVRTMTKKPHPSWLTQEHSAGEAGGNILPRNCSWLPHKQKYICWGQTHNMPADQLTKLPTVTILPGLLSSFTYASLCLANGHAGMHAKSLGTSWHHCFTIVFYLHECKG